ncbi:MAG TPA: fumarylacetoacetate hydrolase family protein [Actinomycetota bacterium]|nr:fumarylacetoacetate hydrolase family protein [Actinomycetota bacterium]
MTIGVFKLRLADGTDRLGAGDVEEGPAAIGSPELTFDAILVGDGPSLDEAIAAATDPVPAGATVVAPVGSQEIWAAGVTYLRSRDARIEEAHEPSPYDRVYEAERPELFPKAPGWRAVGPGTPVGVRRDSDWDVPEPELALVVDARGTIVGYTIGNDVSSRSIEGANTLYLPQAKTYDGSCALGPAIVPVSSVEPPFEIRMRIERAEATVYDESTSTSEMVRSFDDLVEHLRRALTFPAGAVLLTGTGLVPDPPFTLVSGDDVRISVTGLGTLANPVRAVGATTR